MNVDRINKAIFLKWLGIFTICVVIFYSMLSWYFSSLVIIPERNAETINEIHSTNAQPSKNLKLIQATDSIPELWYLQRSSNTKCAIIFTHGWGSSRTNMSRFQRAFESTHCDFVSYDLRGHATNPHPYSTGGIREKEDLLAIHHYLRDALNLSDKQIAWFGVSLGGSVSLQAAASEIDPAFIVADSPFQDWDSAIFERGIEMYGPWVTSFKPGLTAIIYLRAKVLYTDASVLNSTAKIASPVLLIHSLNDRDTAPGQSQAIFNQLNLGDLNNNKTELHLTEWGSDHAKDIDNRPNEYAELINNFLIRQAPTFVTKPAGIRGGRQKYL